MHNRKFFNSLNKTSGWLWPFNNHATLVNWLISYYKADTSWSFPDSHWSNNWVISWASYTASGKINWAYSFDWLNDYVDLLDNVDLRLLWNYSISFWIKSNNNSVIQRYINKDDALDFSWGYALTLAGWQIILTHNNWVDQNYWTWFNPPVWVWTYLTLTFDWSNRKFYVNWIQSWWNIWTSWNMTWDTNKLYIWTFGASVPQGQYMDWLIDEIWIWDKALITSEITDLYNSWNWLSY